MEILNKKASGKQIKLPEKRKINLAESLEKRVSWLFAVPGILIIVIAAGAFGKVAVADRLQRLNEANAKTAELQSQVDVLYDKYNALGEVKEEYGHYTYSGLTEEEQQYFNREEMMDLIEDKVMTKAETDGWQVKEDQLIIPLRANSLDTVKNIVSDLETDPLVAYVTLNNANTVEAEENASEYVTAQLTVYLNAGDGGDEQ